MDLAALPPAPRSTPPPWLIYVAVFAGGMLGGTTRYLIGLAIPAEPGRIPWAILGINLTGAFIMALLLAGWARRGHVAHPCVRNGALHQRWQSHRSIGLRIRSSLLDVR